MAKTMNAEAPMEAMTTACCQLRKYRTMNTDSVASRLWSTECFQYFLNSPSILIHGCLKRSSASVE